jgi:MFS family permease
MLKDRARPCFAHDFTRGVARVLLASMIQDEEHIAVPPSRHVTESEKTSSLPLRPFTTSSSTVRGTNRLGIMFRALGRRNFRIFWLGAFLSNIGTWMQAVAQGWLVLKITGSPFWLGVEGFMATAPGLVLTLAGGVFADLVDRRKLLLFTQIGAGLSALALAILVVTDLVTIWMILALSFLTGSCMSLAGPSYHAMTIDLVDREELANAVALNSTQFQLSRAVGPMFAGLGFKFFGLAGCFFANAISFVAVIVGLLMLELKAKDGGPTRTIHDRKALWRDMIDGFRYVRHRPRVFTLLLICCNYSASVGNKRLSCENTSERF